MSLWANARSFYVFNGRFFGSFHFSLVNLELNATDQALSFITALQHY